MDSGITFPILSTRIGKNPLVYLDNAATTQKPQAVLQAELNYYEKLNSNIHRGAHYLSRMATDRSAAAQVDHVKGLQFLHFHVSVQIKNCDVFFGNTAFQKIIHTGWQHSNRIGIDGRRGNE